MERVTVYRSRRCGRTMTFLRLSADFDHVRIKITDKHHACDLYLIFRRDAIKQLWDQLQEELNNRRNRLNRTITLQKHFQNILLLQDSIDETKTIIQGHIDSVLLEGNEIY